MPQGDTLRDVIHILDVNFSIGGVLASKISFHEEDDDEKKMR